MEIKFSWDHSGNVIGRHECLLYEDDKIIDSIRLIDYTCESRQRVDRENGYVRPYAFEVTWCHGWRMKQGFDYDKDYDNHFDEKGKVIGGYQGNCTHRILDIYRWCENWLAQRYLRDYYETLEDIKKMKERAEWFENHGFSLEKEQEEMYG